MNSEFILSILFYLVYSIFLYFLYYVYQKNSGLNDNIFIYLNLDNYDIDLQLKIKKAFHKKLKLSFVIFIIINTILLLFGNFEQFIILTTINLMFYYIYILIIIERFVDMFKEYNYNVDDYSALIMYGGLWYYNEEDPNEIRYGKFLINVPNFARPFIKKLYLVTLIFVLLTFIIIFITL